MSPQTHETIASAAKKRRPNSGLSLCFACIVLSLTTPQALALGPKWLKQRFNKVQPLEIEADTIDTSESTPMQPAEPEHNPLLVVATHEGQVWTIDSTDGSIIAGFSTGPPLLVMDNHYDEAGTDDTSLGLSQHPQIVPSMDGIVYWRSSSTATDGGPKLTPISPIRDLVDNPIQICPQGDGHNCDILTATSLGPSLFSLNSQGSLNWARARETGETTRAKPVPMQRTSSSSSDLLSDDDNDDSSTGSSDSTASTASKSSLLLQRQDYLVQQISTETGEQISNITWGNLERIDFMGDTANSKRRNEESFHFLPSDIPAGSALPSIIFRNQGKSIVAIMTEPPKFLWKQDFISVVTGVFGIEKNAWQPVSVAAGNESSDEAPPDHRQRMFPELPSHSQQADAQEEAERWYWFWAGNGGLGKKNHHTKDMEQYLIPGQDDNGMIFVPRPSATNLVRNSWYLNHFWNSPQAMGAQSFQGLLSDHSQEEEEARKKGKAAQTTKQQQQAYPTNFYDAATMPRLLLLPPSGEHPQADTTKPGGVFLSWSVVMAIVTLLVGTVGAAYIIYGNKKRKWLAVSKAQPSTASADVQVSAYVDSDTMSISMIKDYQGRSVSGLQEKSQSQSKDRSQSLSEEPFQRNSDSNIGKRLPQLPVANPLVKHVLSRSSSAPIMTNDHAPSLGSQISHNLDIKSLHLKKDASMQQSSSPSEKGGERAVADEPVVETPEPAPLQKYQSAPAQAPHLPQGGVGMIDGIPLIRYSRYQSEFREMEPLGRGGFGTVFRVANVLDGREYAVKKVSIRSSDWNSPGTEAFSVELHRVLREVKFLALLDHPNIVRYYTAWLEMEEKEETPGAIDETSNTLSRRFSSELLTSLDPTNNDTTATNARSFLGKKQPSSSRSKATLSHLKGRNATNPLGWNNFNNFEESSASAFHPRHTMPVLPPTDEDCGFIFEERSDEEEEEDTSFGGDQRHAYYGRSVASSEGSKSDFSHSVSSSWDASFSLNQRPNRPSARGRKNNAEGEEAQTTPAPMERRNSKASRHTLYIQMQLCSSKTLGEFLSDKEARQGPSSAGSGGTVDIPKALRLFLQIVQAVQHVHMQNLIHRDLKPSNCFIDDRGTVKVGDFGLSRESNDGNESSVNSASTSLLLDPQEDGAGDNTVGVGTRSYASPEQMNGSDYDSKTDIYSLGIMLFELLHPMHTGMERHICFQQVRTSCTFPDAWHSTVSGPFPALHELAKSMLSLSPKDRPPADKIARRIQSLLEEHSVSLNFSLHDCEHDKVMFVRVEAKPLPDILKIASDLIHDAASPQTVDIVQYGMRSSTKNSNVAGQKGEKRAILEFALASTDVEPTELSTWATGLASKLEASNEILVARHVWHHVEQSY